MTRGQRRDLRGELEDFDGEYPESWIPAVGDILVGEVLRYSRGTTNWGSYPICVLRDERTGEERSVWLMHTVLLDEFRKQRPKVGERVGVKRLPDADGGRYRRYALRIDRPEPDASDLLEDAEPADFVPESQPGPQPDPEPPPPIGEPEDDLPF